MAKTPDRIINIPDGVQVIMKDKELEIIGPKGRLVQKIPSQIQGLKIIQEKNQIFTQAERDQDRKFAGTFNALITNGIIGVQQEHQKELEIKGGKVLLKEQELELTLGKSHSDKLAIPFDLKITCPTNNRIIIEGVDKEKVGSFSAKICALRRPNPYKLKGIYPKGMIVRLKAGKSANK